MIHQDYDKINNWHISDFMYLFTDIFCRNNEIVMICPVYGNYGEILKYENINVLWNGDKLKKKILKYIEWEPIVIVTIDFPLCQESFFSIYVEYMNLSKEYILYHKTFIKKYNLMTSTLFKYDYNCLCTFIDYYMKQGSDYFILYYNGIIPNNIQKTLSKYKNVLLIGWDYIYWTPYKLQHHAQICQMNHVFYKYAKPLSDYIISVDLDEYLYIENCSLLSFVKKNNIYDVFSFYNYWAYIDLRIKPENGTTMDLTIQKIFKHKQYTESGRTKTIVNTNNVKTISIHHVKKQNNLKILINPNMIMIHFFYWSKNRNIDTPDKYTPFKFIIPPNI